MQSASNFPAPTSERRGNNELHVYLGFRGTIVLSARGPEISIDNGSAVQSLADLPTTDIPFHSLLTFTPLYKEAVGHR